MTDERTPIAYVEHPCDRKQKRDIQKKGFKIIDARFKPQKLESGDKLFAKSKPKEEGAKQDA